MSELRQALLDDPAAPSLFKPETIPTEKVDLLELLRETRESAAEPPSAQDDDGAKWRAVCKMFKGLKRSDDPAVVLHELVPLWELVCKEDNEEEASAADGKRHAHPLSTPMLRAAPRVTRSSGGGIEVHHIKRAAAAQICVELCGSPQTTACVLVLCHIFWFLCVPKQKYLSSLSSISNYTDQRIQIVKEQSKQTLKKRLTSYRGSISVDGADRSAQGARRKIQVRHPMHLPTRARARPTHRMHAYTHTTRARCTHTTYSRARHLCAHDACTHTTRARTLQCLLVNTYDPQTDQPRQDLLAQRPVPTKKSSFLADFDTAELTSITPEGMTIEEWISGRCMA